MEAWKNLTKLAKQGKVGGEKVGGGKFLVGGNRANLVNQSVEPLRNQ